MNSLFRKRNKGKYSPTVQTRSISNKELSELIEQLQKNADQVEKNIVDTEAKMQSDLARLQEGRQPEHRDVTLQKVSDSEKLLYVLEADAAIAKHMKHPQGDMIAEDIRQLKERVISLRGKHKQIYNLVVKEVDPQVNWAALVDEKLDKLSGQGFGTDLPLVDHQVEQHNIFHNEVKAIGPHLAKDGGKENSELQAKYQKLLAASQARQQHLSSLQDYMQRCTNELYWLDQQAKGRVQYDWSDRNLDYPSRRRQYENFINRNLEAKEERINKLHSEGDQLLAAEHPGRNSIEAHMEAVHADWKEYLNLLICEESHLKYMEDYHQFHRDMKDAQELLHKVDLDLNQKYGPDFKDKYQIELLLRELDDQEKALDKYEHVVRGLEKRGQQVVPLKYRRETPLKPIPVEALCDFEGDQGLISRGYSYTLQSNNGDSWDLTDSSGNKLTAPAVCFVIPPTDPEALALVDSLGSQYRSVRQKAARSKSALQQRHEVLKAENPGDPSDLQGRHLLAGLDKVARDLERQEKAVTGILRPPLEQGRAVQDSAERAKDLKNITNELRRIEPEKARSTAECEEFVQALPGSSSTSLLKTRVEDTNRKYERLVQLLDLAQEKVDMANRLEQSLQRGWEALATYENQLTQDDTVPESGHALDSKRQELEVLASKLQTQKSLLAEVEQNLQAAKQCSSSLASRFQEHCPDLERQEVEVHKLGQRSDNVCQQVELRAQSLQSARAAYEDYRSGYDHMLQFLSHIPSYEPQETDSLSQMETKLKNQKNLLDEIARREEEVHQVCTHSQQYQQAVKDYELEAEKLRSLLDLENGRSSHVSKRARLQSPAAKVREEEAALVAKFTEVNAINRQRLQNLEFALSLLRQQPEVGASHETLQGSTPGSTVEETWKVQKELDEETERRQQLEKEVQSAQEEIRTLQHRSPQEAVIKKEVLKKVPDPVLEESFQQMQRTLVEEQHKNQLLQEELEALRLRLHTLEQETRDGGQEYVVKEVLRIEPDRAQADEVLKLREELEELRRQKGTREAEAALLQQRIAALAEEKNQAQEKVTKKEVVKLQNDPQLEAEYRRLQEDQQREGKLREEHEEEVSFLQDKLKRLEKERAMAEGKITVKEVLKLEKDVATEREVGDLKRQYEDEEAKARANQREKTELLRKIWALEEENARVLVQEKVREIVRPDPEAEREVANLRLELVEQERKYRGAEEQLKSYQSELEALRRRGPQVEVKEVTKEVIKYKTDPEMEKELQRLREEIVDKTRLIERCDVEIYQLKQEIQSLKDTKPQVQTKEVVQEILQFQEDPQTKEEVQSLRARLSEEQKKQVDLERERASQEEKIKQKEEELSHVKEKVVQQEVVRYEEEPGLRAEVNAFTESIDAELRQIDTLRGELRRLQRRRAELERQLEELERERQARREAELEVQRLKQRLAELEEEGEAREKVTLKQKVVLQQDPQQAREHALLKVQLEEERHRRQVLESELETLRKKLVNLEKMEVKEKVVFSESVQVEKGDTEQEIQKLKSSLEEESRSKRELDAEVSRLEAKLSELEFCNSKSSKELDFLREENHRLQLERQSLQLETRRLQSEIEMAATETRDLRNVTAVDSGTNLNSRLWSLERELDDLKRLSKDKDLEIDELQKRLGSVAVKREQRENHLRRSIVVIDPDTGRELSPEEAHRVGLIDWNMFVKLRSQECDWEEISVKGPSGESSVIHDRKSGRKFSIEEALQKGRLTPAQYDRYVNKDMSIQELAVLVSGQK
ncbi:periplakin isoform X1 [Canis lupus familiaris]|uniref:Periplakin n=1 Tax=Canis lupus dingo TaxID=286419 RepID=A0A8C0LGN4_CANLU|nr:periplakin isoform X1 [Canis lupus dingo]XP_038396402.1 periplakin isoform X1 [Canis lupus familiaris]